MSGQQWAEPMRERGARVAPEGGRGCAWTTRLQELPSYLVLTALHGGGSCRVHGAACPGLSALQQLGADR